MHKKLTITIDEKVYRGLHQKVGAGHISNFIESLVRPHVAKEDLEAGYRAMAQDTERERDALEWSDGLIRVPSHETR